MDKFWSRTVVWLWLRWHNPLEYQSNLLTSKTGNEKFLFYSSLIYFSELARFIAAGRLNCVIDKVNGVVLTNKVDLRTEKYQSVLKSGDQLINKLQKLGRVISY